MSITQQSAGHWFHYGTVVEALGGCWQGVTVGPAEPSIIPAPSMPTGFGVDAALLGGWSHEPSVQEVAAKCVCPPLPPPPKVNETKRLLYDIRQYQQILLTEEVSINAIKARQKNRKQRLQEMQKRLRDIDREARATINNTDSGGTP